MQIFKMQLENLRLQSRDREGRVAPVWYKVTEPLWERSTETANDIHADDVKITHTHKDEPMARAGALLRVDIKCPFVYEWQEGAHVGLPPLA